jgi:hypothetical protein
LQADTWNDGLPPLDAVRAAVQAEGAWRITRDERRSGRERKASKPRSEIEEVAKPWIQVGTLRPWGARTTSRA